MAASKTKKTKQEKVESALANMTKPLVASYEKAAAALSESVTGYGKGRYDVGVVVKQVQDDPDKYGKKPVKLLAIALGRDEDSLYNYAAVAAAWPDKRSFNALFSCKNIHGVPLSFSHLIELAKVEDDDRRKGLFQEALDRGYKVKDLRELVGQRRAGKKAKRPAAVELPKRLSRSLRKLTKGAEELKAFAAEWKDAPRTTESLAKLQEALQERAQLRVELTASLLELEQLEKELAGLQTELEEPTAAAAGRQDNKSKAKTEGVSNPTAMA